MATTQTNQILDSSGKPIRKGFYRDSKGELIYVKEFREESNRWEGESLSGTEGFLVNIYASSHEQYHRVEMKDLRIEFSNVLRKLEGLAGGE